MQAQTLRFEALHLGGGDGHDHYLLVEGQLLQTHYLLEAPGGLRGVGRLAGDLLQVVHEQHNHPPLRDAAGGAQLPDRRGQRFDRGGVRRAFHQVQVLRVA